MASCCSEKWDKLKKFFEKSTSLKHDDFCGFDFSLRRLFSSLLSADPPRDKERKRSPTELATSDKLLKTPSGTFFKAWAGPDKSGSKVNLELD